MEKPLFDFDTSAIHPGIVKAAELRADATRRLATGIAQKTDETIRQALPMFDDAKLMELAEAGRIRWLRKRGETFQTLVFDGTPVLVLHDLETKAEIVNGTYQLVATHRYQR